MANGFVKIVVRPGVEPLHSLIDLRLRSQNEDGRLNPLSTNAFDDIQAGQRGQHQVDDDRVVVGGKGHLQALGTVFAQINRITLLLKRSLDEAADFGFIFNDEDSHGGNGGL